MRGDVEFQKRIFPQTFKAQIDEDNLILKEINHEVKNFLVREESLVKQNEFDKLSKELSRCAPKSIILEIKDDIKDLATK